MNSHPANWVTVFTSIMAAVMAVGFVVRAVRGMLTPGKPGLVGHEELSLRPQTSEEERPVPKWLLQRYPWLEGAPRSVWEQFWPFPDLPPEPVGIYPWAIEELMKIRLGPGTQAEKQAEWTALILDGYYSGLLSEGEKEELLQWQV